MKELHIPGMSVAVVQHGKILYMHTYGIANVEWDQPVTKNTAFQIALAGAVLANLGFGLNWDFILLAGSPIVAGLTIASGALYMREWLRHMANGLEEDR